MYLVALDERNLLCTGWMKGHEELSHPPKFIHDRLEDAEKEALRLSRENIGQEFVVLTAVASVKCDEPNKPKWLELNSQQNKRD